MNPTKQQIARARVLVVGDAMLDRTGTAPSNASPRKRRCRW